jgi:NAD(P)-dependent dehydrogenase (short-subunit alcohol dehydrogenase family)
MQAEATKAVKGSELVALVTGASRGLGRALVEELLRGDARRIYAGAREPATVGDLTARHGDRVVSLALDITDPKSIEAAARRATDINLLINNAGIGAFAPILAAQRADVERELTTNYLGTLDVIRAFVPVLERNRGAIANILSIASLASAPGMAGYSASKAAAFSMTQSLRPQLAERGIRVHGVFPGPIDTDMADGFEIEKASPGDVARGIVDGLLEDAEDIYPDPVARAVAATWRSDPKALERELSTFGD